MAERLRRAADGLDLELRIDGDAIVELDPVKFDVAFAAIAGLLADTLDRETVIRVRITRSKREWQLEVEAETARLDEDVARHLFDPYLRPRPGDVGRGLAFARAVFQAHGGDLSAGLDGARLGLGGRARVRPAGDAS